MVIDRPRDEIISYSNFASVVTGEGDWILGGFLLPEGGFWRYQEPNAVVIVQDGFLKVAAVPYSRAHDKMQILDNAKHMYFSTRSFAAPAGGTVSFAIDMSATVINGRDGDLYDGFVSFNVLDFSTGTALDFFVGNNLFATVYGKLPFPGVPSVAVENGPQYFCLFEEMRNSIASGSLHHYEVAYDAEKDLVRFLVDGSEIRRYANVPVKLGACTLAMGLMTEKDIDAGRGSVSCHGQGAIGRWGNIRIVRGGAA